MLTTLSYGCNANTQKSRTYKQASHSQFCSLIVKLKSKHKDIVPIIFGVFIISYFHIIFNVNAVYNINNIPTNIRISFVQSSIFQYQYVSLTNHDSTIINSKLPVVVASPCYYFFFVRQYS